MDREELRSQLKDVDMKPKKRRKKNYLLRFIIFVVLIALLIMFLRSDFFKIKKITVEGSDYHEPNEVVTIADAKTGGNIFWGAGEGQIKKRLLKNPYFEDVSIKRILPNEIKIIVKERKQTAAFVYGDQYVVIDENANVLRIGEIDPKLTLLTGLQISKIKEGEQIQVIGKKKLKLTLNMINSMKKGDFYFKKIDISDSFIMAYINDAFVCKGSPENMVESIEKGDLQKVVNKLIENGTTRGTITLGGHDFISYSPDF